MNETYLITGATGFIGSCLAYRLVKLGKSMHTISKKLKGNWRLKDIPLSSRTFVRDFVFIDDVVDVYLQACIKKFKPGEVFNIESGKQYSLGNIVTKILTITKSDSVTQWGEIAKQQRQTEPTIWKADLAKTTKTLQWKPKHSLDEGLKNTITWFRKNQTLYD